MTVRDIRIKGEQFSFLAHADSAEQLLIGTATGETPTGWNSKVKGPYLYWVDDDGAERRKEGTLTGESRSAGDKKVKGETLLYGDINGAERSLSAVVAGVTVEVRISNALDDCSLEDGSFADDEECLLGKESTRSWKQALRFRNVTVPQGATITAAYITFREGNTDTNDTCNVRIAGNDVDDGVSPTDNTEFEDLVLTAATVDWDALPHATEYTTRNSPSIVSIIQEIVDRGSWASGNAMQFRVDDNGSDNSARRRYTSFDEEEDEAPLLHIEYS